MIDDTTKARDRDDARERARRAERFRLMGEPPFGRFARGVGGVAAQMGKGYYSFCPTDTWTPDVNLYERADAYLVCVDLAGVDKEQIDLTVADGRLTLRGQRAMPSPPPDDFATGEPRPADAPPRPAKMRLHLMEVDHGSFCREVELPQDIDRKRINALYRNGLLWVELPKTTPDAMHDAE